MPYLLRYPFIAARLAKGNLRNSSKDFTLENSIFLRHYTQYVFFVIIEQLRNIINLIFALTYCHFLTLRLQSVKKSGILNKIGKGKRRMKIILTLFFLAIPASCYSQDISLSNEEIDWIGKKIFVNECAGKTECLISWNAGEDFASLGIGHFIWYPKGKKGVFDESFPQLLDFFKSKGIELPSWLQESSNPDCPWNTREEFIQNLQSQKMIILRRFLVDTVPLQALFMANRLQKALPKMLKAVPKESRAHIRQQFYRVVNTSSGMYVLIDYVNFKGEGVLQTERYKGKGWGLLQVLEGMEGSESGIKALQEFSRAAEIVLTRRINNAPGERREQEQRWLPVWKKRIRTYTGEALQ